MPSCIRVKFLDWIIRVRSLATRRKMSEIVAVNDVFKRGDAPHVRQPRGRRRTYNLQWVPRGAVGDLNVDRTNSSASA